MRKLLAFIVVVVIATGAVQSGLTGNAPLVSLGKAQPLDGTISQSLDTTGGNTTMPVAGKDYSLDHIKYFDNNEWVVASIKPLSNSISAGTVVLQKKNEIYQVVLGPGTAFNNSYLFSLPSDVGSYLNNKGVIYEFSYQ